MKLKRIHHVAYRCKDAKETVEFYQRILNMEFTVAFAEDQVPSTKEPDPYMHVFLDCGAGDTPRNGSRSQYTGVGAAHRVRTGRL
jgi:catechol 2,3-dioxygenase-like lactoylglutathione lyase family enzyme